MAFRNKKMTMPSIDDIIMQIMAMNEAFYESRYSIGWAVWDSYRPATWPTADYLLKFYGYTSNNAGWDELLLQHVGIERKTLTQIRIEQGEMRARKRCDLTVKPDYSASPDGHYLALMSDGFAICQATYERTGRMVLR